MEHFQDGKGNCKIKKTAIFSTWEDNRTKLIGEGLPDAGSIQFDYSFDGFEKDTVKFPHKLDRKYNFVIDELVSIEASKYLVLESPDVSWVYLEYTDDVVLKYRDGHKMDKAVQLADMQVGRVWEAVKHREENQLLVKGMVVKLKENVQLGLQPM